MSDNVVKLPEPKSSGGYTSTSSWSVRYNTETGKYDWQVTHKPKPNTFQGSADSYTAALDTAKEIMRTVNNA